MGCSSENHLGVVEVQEEGASHQEEVSRDHFPSPLVVDSLVPLAIDIGGLLLKKEGTAGRQIGCVLDPFQEEAEPVPEMLHPLVSVAVEALDIVSC